jgi:transposase
MSTPNRRMMKYTEVQPDKQDLKEGLMLFQGIDLHTNKFTVCTRSEKSSVENPKDRTMATYDLTEAGLAAYFKTLSGEVYVLIEATITSFCFARLIQERVKEVIIANTYELKQISLSRKNTDKVDADTLCRIVKMQVLSGERTISPVTIPPVEIQDLRSLFSTYRLLRKMTTQVKNRIHSLLKEKLYGFTQEEIFDKKSRVKIRTLEAGSAMSMQVNLLLDKLERDEADLASLKEEILLRAAPYLKEIDILTSLKGVSVFIAIAIITDIIEVNRFKDSKHFTSYLRSAPHVANSNTSVSIRGTQKKGRKLSATLLSESLNHVLKASSKLDKWYNRMIQYKKPGLVRTGLRRRVFAEIYQMLKKGEYHYGREPSKHEAKMRQYKNLLKKHQILEKCA